MATKKKRDPLQKYVCFKDSVVKKYKKDPNHCPYCGSKEIDTDGDDYEDGVVTMMMSCSSCKKLWCDDYVLSNTYPVGGTRKD